MPLHTYSDSLDPGLFLLSTECSPFLAYRWVSAGNTNYQGNDSEEDGENAKDEHGRARKGRKIIDRDSDSRLYILYSLDSTLVEGYPRAAPRMTSENRGWRAKNYPLGRSA